MGGSGGIWKAFGIAAMELLLLGRPCEAQEGGASLREERSFLLPTVVVGATRLPDVSFDLSRVPADVTVITAEEIKRSGATTVQEVLAQQPGVVLFDEIGNRFQPTVDLRGFNGAPTTGVTVVVDGVRVNEPDFNQVNYDLLPLEAIERIEIIPGASAIFGKNALAGVINIVTKRGTIAPQTIAEVAGGSFGHRRFTLTTSGPIKAFDYYLGVSREDEDGFRDNSGSGITRILTKLGYRVGNTTDLSLAYTHVDDDLKQAGSLTPQELRHNREQSVTPGEVASELNLLIGNLRQALPFDHSIALNGFIRQRSSEASNVGRTSTSRSMTDVDSKGGTAQLSHDITLLGHRSIFTLGAELTRNEIDRELEAQFGDFPFTSNSSISEDLLSFYAQESLNLSEPLVLTLGVRYDREKLHFTDRLDPSNRGVRRFERWTPRAGLNYNFSKDIGLYASYAEGFRPPSADEISALGPFSSNLNLKPVKSQNYEVGGRAKLGAWLEGSAAFFHTSVRDEIFFVLTDPLLGIGQNVNISRSRRQGFEISLKPRYGDWVDGFITYTFTEATFQSEFVLPKPPFPNQQRVKKGDEFPQVPNHRVSAGVNYHPSRDWTFSLNAVYVGEQFLFGDESNSEAKLSDYLVFNTKVTYQRGNLTAFLMGNNLFDTTYETRGILATNPNTLALDRFLVPAPGIGVFVGVSYRYEGYY
jgi:iron complex outermembrane receptor protein